LAVLCWLLSKAGSHYEVSQVTWSSSRSTFCEYFYRIILEMSNQNTWLNKDPETRCRVGWTFILVDSKAPRWLLSVPVTASCIIPSLSLNMHQSIFSRNPSKTFFAFPLPQLAWICPSLNQSLPRGTDYYDWLKLIIWGK
jgi:hypothetical protein